MRAALLLARSLRATAPRAIPRAALPLRSLHVSARRLASENPFAQDPRIVELRNKIQEHEGARAAIMKLGELMQSKGESKIGRGGEGEAWGEGRRQERG